MADYYYFGWFVEAAFQQIYVESDCLGEIQKQINGFSIDINFS